MREVFNKIIERMNGIPTECFVSTYGNHELVSSVIDSCIEVVEETAAKYHDDWTPVSEGLPKENVNYNVSCKSDNKEWVTTMVWMNGLFGNRKSFNDLVVAWKPMPESYKEV